MSDFLIVPSVSLINGNPATTSLAIAECFDKKHAHVLRDIEKLIAECPQNFTQSNFGLSEYTDSTGRKLPMYHVFFDGFMLLVMGYTGKKALEMKLAYISAFNAMREKLEETRQHNLPELSAILQSIVDAKVLHASNTGTLKRILYARAWNSFRAHFGIGKNDSLPPSRMAEAINFLVQLDLSPKKKAISENSERINPPSSDKIRKMIVEDIDKVEKKLRQIESLIKWQLSPTSKDAGFTQEKMNFFYMMLHLNNMAMGGIYTARQALAIAGKMKE